MYKSDWEPDSYLKFGKDRIHPTMDLVSRIDMEHPANILEIGCGSGDSTQVLHKRWPDSKILGIDTSEKMINKAKQDYPDQEWKCVNSENEIISDTFDIVFLNATNLWIHDLVAFLNRLKSSLSESGVLAIQLPLFTDMQLGDVIKHISRDKKWAHLTKDVHNLFTIMESVDYYDMLSEIYSSIEAWETIYFHILKSNKAIIKIIRSTGIKPYLDKLENETDKKEFESKVLDGIKEDCEVREDGKAIFPFSRLLIIARK